MSYPTMYFRGLDNLIATARSNKVAVLLGFQDFSQLYQDYGDKEAKVIINTVGNHAEILVDNVRVAGETKAYQKIPIITNFIDAEGVDRMNDEIDKNYYQIKADMQEVVDFELNRIKNDDKLKHLVK